MEANGPVISPLVTSALRFLFISVLVLCNGSACWKVAAGKYQIKVGRSWRSSQIILCTVLCVNLLYLCLVWAPFTLQALSHDINHLQKALDNEALQQQSPYTKFLEEDGVIKGVIQEEITLTSEAKFVSDVRGQNLDVIQHKMRRDLSDAKRAEWSAIFEGARREATIPEDLPHQLSLRDREMTGGSLSWGSGMQDFITSSCAYALAFTAVMKTAIQKMHVILPGGSLSLGGIVVFLIGVPAALTLTLRIVASGNHFAEHELYTSSGYTFYNIICSVHITESYVVSLFLEWAALLTLVLVATGILLAARLRDQHSNKLPREEQDEQESRGIEEWARDIVLVIGAAWAWPVKPAMVLALYCTYGSHWTNLVCWFSHLVVSIPVVFLPLSVFLNRTSDDSSDKEPKVVMTQQHKSSQPQIILKSEKSEDVVDSKTSEKSKSMSSSKDSKVESSKVDPCEDARENLKFYLGKDIFKNKEKTPSENRDVNNIKLKSESTHPSFSNV